MWPAVVKESVPGKCNSLGLWYPVEWHSKQLLKNNWSLNKCDKDESAFLLWPTMQVNLKVGHNRDVHGIKHGSVEQQVKFLPRRLKIPLVDHK